MADLLFLHSDHPGSRLSEPFPPGLGAHREVLLTFQGRMRCKMWNCSDWQTEKETFSGWSCSPTRILCEAVLWAKGGRVWEAEHEPCSTSGSPVLPTVSEGLQEVQKAPGCRQLTDCAADHAEGRPPAYRPAQTTVWSQVAAGTSEGTEHPDCFARWVGCAQCQTPTRWIFVHLDLMSCEGTANPRRQGMFVS